MDGLAAVPGSRGPVEKGQAKNLFKSFFPNRRLSFLSGLKEAKVERKSDDLHFFQFLTFLRDLKKFGLLKFRPEMSLKALGWRRDLNP